MSKLNEKLRVLLKNNGWTQKRLAEVLHVSPDAVSSWVRGKNHVDLETLLVICRIFYIPIQDITNDELEIPKYYKIGRYLPYSRYCNVEGLHDSEHIVFEAYLADGASLHRFKNAAKDECSAIYLGSHEIWWQYRDHEAKMIYDWNARYST